MACGEPFRKMLFRFSTGNLVWLNRWFQSCATFRRAGGVKKFGYEDAEEEEEHEGDTEYTTFGHHLAESDESHIPLGKFTPALALNASGERIPICLPTVLLPKELEEAVKSVLSRHNKKECVKDGLELSHYLYNRIPVGCEWKKDTKKLEINENATNSKSLRSSYNSNMVWASKPHKAITSDDSKQQKAMKWASTIRYNKRECLAFLASRTQASYGTALRVLSEIATLDKSYAPGTLLDFGSGLGTVEWAAHSLWKSSMYEYQCVDISKDMLEMAKTLRLGGIETAELLNSENQELKGHIPGVYSRQYLSLSRQMKYDIVVAAHTLGELASVSLRRFSISALWRKTNDYLVIIEPGTWSGYKLMLEARNLILNAKEWTLFEDENVEDLEGHVLAPCPHDFQCPLMKEQQPKTPCHFAQRVQLSESEKQTHLKKLSCHIEGFTYLIFKKGPRHVSSSVHHARLIEPARKRSRHFNCTLCISEGEVEKCTFSKKKHKCIYKDGRRSKWGDLFTFDTSTTS